MSITFKPEKNQFLIETENTVYAFHIAYNRFLQHDYYGTKTAEPPLYIKSMLIEILVIVCL